MLYLMEMKVSDVSKFSILALTLTSKTQKTRKLFQDLRISKNLFCLTKLKISHVSEFCILFPMMKSKHQKAWKFCLHLQILKQLFYLRKLEMYKVFEFLIFALGKLGNFFSRLVNFKKIVLHEKVGNICDFWVLEFWPYIKIGNIFKNCIFPRLRSIWGSCKFSSFRFQHLC